MQIAAQGTNLLLKRVETPSQSEFDTNKVSVEDLYEVTYAGESSKYKQGGFVVAIPTLSLKLGGEIYYRATDEDVIAVVVK